MKTHNHLTSMKKQFSKKRTFVILVTTMFISSTFLFPWFDHKTPYKAPKPKIHSSVMDLEFFKESWCREKTARVDWQVMVKSCQRNLAWNAKKEGWGLENRTSAFKSYVIYSDIRPQGQYSRLFIQSMTANGTKKSIGGDSWRVYIDGPSFLAGTVFDHMNGTYEALFLVMEPGKYSVTIVLDYSLCDGIRDPPYDWFVRGNKHGKLQPHETLGNISDFLFTSLGKNTSMKLSPSLQIDIPLSNYPINFTDYVPQIICSHETRCQFLWDGFGRWNDKKWLPFSNFRESTSNILTIQQAPNARRKGRLFVYGDSLGVRFYNQVSRHPICTSVFEKCQNFYNWIYPIASGEASEIKIQDDLEINLPKIIWRIEDSLKILQQSEGSLLLINAGLHFIESSSFHNYMVFIDNLVGIFKSVENDKRTETGVIIAHKVKVIWKTTTAIRKEHGKDFHSVPHRFLSYHRVLLFNAYATAVMCKFGIEVVDVFPLSASFPPGTLHDDVVHYDGRAFVPLVEIIHKYSVKMHQENDLKLPN